MKKIILLFAILVSINYNLNAQIAITGNITTAGVAVYPTHIDSLGKGGLMTLPDLTTRNALPVKRRKQGMLVFVQANDSLYKLATADLSNNGWVAMGLLTQQKLTDSLNSRLKGADTLSLSNRINLKANVDNITDMNNALTLKLNIIDTTDLFQKRDTSFLLQKKDTSSLSNRIDLKASITALNNLNTTINNKLAIDTSYLLQKKDTSYLLQKADTASLSNRINLKTNTDDFIALTTKVGTKFKTTDTSYLLQKADTASLSNRINLKANTTELNTLIIKVGTKLNTTDTSYLLQKADTASLSNRIDLKTNTVDFITLTTTVGTKFKTTDTSYLLQKTDTASLSNRINLKANTTELNTLITKVGTKLNTTDTSYLLQKADTISLSNRINLKLDANKSGVANGVASLNALGKIPSDQIPAISFSSVRIVNTEAEMLGLTSAVVGSVAVRTDVNKSFILAVSDPTVLNNWTMLLTPAPPVQSVNTYSGNVNLTKKDIGLGNVDDYSAENLPLSLASRNELALKLKITDTSYLLQKTDTASLSNRINLKANTTDLNTLITKVGTKLNTTDTSFLLQKADTASLSNRINLKANTTELNTLITKVGTKLNTSDTSYLLQKADTASLSNRINLKANTTELNTLITKVGTKLNTSDTSYLLQKADTASLSNRINLKANTTELNTLITKVGTKLNTSDTSYLLQKADTASLSNRINKKFNTTDTSFLLKKTDTSFLLKKTDTSFLLKKSDTTYLLQKVDTTAILAMYAKKFTKDVVLNGVSSFGKYTNGQTIPAKGKTLDEFLYDVVTKVVLPTYTAPSVSISASPAFGAYEIGYDPGQVTLSNTYTKNDAGNVTLTTYNKGGTSLGAGVNINSPGPITSSVSYNVTVNYGAGTTVKNDNLGNPYPTGQITAGSTSSGSGSYSTYSKRFWGGTSVAFTASNTYNYASLSQALGSDNSGSSNSITVSLTPTGTQNVFFAYLASSPDLSSVLYNGLENIDAFTKTLINITNAQGHTQSYKVYTSKEVYSSMLKDIIFK